MTSLILPSNWYCFREVSTHLSKLVSSNSNARPRHFKSGQDPLIMKSNLSLYKSGQCLYYSVNVILEFWSTAAIQLTDVTSKNCFDRERLMWIRFARHIPFRRAHINSKALYKLDLAREAAPGWKKDWPRVQSCSHRVMQRYGKR